MNPTLSIQSKYVRPLLAAVCVFACCFLVLKFWLNLQSIAAAVAAGISAVGTFFGAVLGLVKTALEIEKLKHEKIGVASIGPNVVDKILTIEVHRVN